MRTIWRTRMAWLAWLTPLAVALGCFAGCGGNESSRQPVKEPVEKPSEEPVEPKAASTWENPTEEECLQLARTMEEALQTGDAKAFNDGIDWDALLERATVGVFGTEEERRSFCSGGKRSMRGGRGLAQRLVDEANSGGSYRLLRIRQRDGQQRALFRQLGPGGSGLNYHELILVRRPDGQVKVVDGYSYVPAELFSKSLRRSFLPLTAGRSGKVRKTLSRQDQELMKYVSQFLELSAAVKDGRGEEALDIYNALPESLRQDKNNLILRLQAASAVDEPTYAAAIEAFRRYHPNDPCLDLVLIDDHLMKGKYDEALASIDRLDKAVGSDPYLNVMRAGAYSEMQDYAKAKQCVRQAIEADDTLINAHWALVNISLDEKDFAETTRLMKTIADRFEFEANDLTTEPEYAEYVKSPHYQEWLDWQRR
ncbi:MAG: hypothetical protein HQ581_04425 [Planctomycetes bacterium]|nr:hypothetical protein [Planctomycetota bacterium]